MRISYDERKILQYTAGKWRNGKSLKRRFGVDPYYLVTLGLLKTSQGGCRFTTTKRGIFALVDARIEVKDEHDFARH